jgi:hypothetical protein
VCAQEEVVDDAIEELTIASKKLESSGVGIEDIVEHIRDYNDLIAELDKLLKKK